MKVVILAGGSGTRLFPLSRSCYPKQFLKIAGQKSLLAQTMDRFLDIAEPKDIIIVTNKDYQFYVQDILQEENAEAANIILEPIGRNTVPAIALVCQYCHDKLKTGADEIIFVVPSDHIIRPQTTFLQLLIKAKKLAQSGKIVTLGVVPDRPETGYGYIKAGKSLTNGGYEVEAFKEKPDLASACAYCRDGNYYWNAGIFVFSLGRMMAELVSCEPAIVNLISQSYEQTLADFPKMPDISIDYAVAEKSKQMAVLPMNLYWNDIGSWDAFSETMTADVAGNVVDGHTELLNCRNTMVLSQKRLLIGIGLQNLNIVETPDVVLVAQKGKSQQIKEVLTKLKSRKSRKVLENQTMYRPWGCYTVLSEGTGFKVKKIVVKPGGRLSLQRHLRRSEHWTVVSGTAAVTNNGTKTVCNVNESTYIPIGCKHRLENLTDQNLVIIEVQVGKNLSEDDIERFDDIYGR